MKIYLIFLAVLLLAACTTTPEQRGPFHEYLHQNGLE
jgi:uncharacterized lipoprotein